MTKRKIDDRKNVNIDPKCRIPIDESGNLFCHICNQYTEYTAMNGYSKAHLKNFHNITPQDYYDKYLKKDNDGLCVSCNKATYFLSVVLGYRKYCCNKCAQNDKSVQDKAKQSILERYGVTAIALVPEFKKKMEATILERYGVTHYSKTPQAREAIGVAFNTAASLEKRKATNLERYGSENVFGNEDIKAKLKATVKAKYGVDNYTQSQEYKESSTQYWSEDQRKEHAIKIKAGVTTQRIEKLKKKLPGYEILDFYIDEYESGCNKNAYRLKCPLGHEFDIQRQLIRLRLLRNVEVCRVCNFYDGTSKPENDLFEYINSLCDELGVKAQQSNRTILDKEYELDIYIKELNLAFEFN